MEAFIGFGIMAGMVLLFFFFRNGPDRTRDDLGAGLQAMGVDARMAERGCPEQETGEGSLGVLDIAHGPIRWINVRKEGSGEDLVYITEYGVPDRRYLPHILIRSVRVKKFPLVGWAVDVRWQGEDWGLGIGQDLGKDEAIRDAIMDTRDEVAVVARRNHACWLIRRRTASIPSPEQWQCYQRIAERLLATSLPASQREMTLNPNPSRG